MLFSFRKSFWKNNNQGNKQVVALKDLKYNKGKQIEYWKDLKDKKDKKRLRETNKGKRKRNR